jgi:hypothetical protein
VQIAGEATAAIAIIAAASTVIDNAVCMNEQFNKSKVMQLELLSGMVMPVIG